MLPPTDVDTLELRVSVPFADHELLIAELDERGAQGFVQEDETLVAYFPADVWTATDGAWLAEHIDVPFEVRPVAPQNWNAAFEASIQPIDVPPFRVQPTWTQSPLPSADTIVLRIDPKMSFGTGHHASTRMMLSFLSDFAGPDVPRVLDAGTGTGVLAIAALALGSESAIGFDIDPWAADNAPENAALNGCSDRLEIRIGDIDVVPETGFDLVLANIQRHIILPMMDDLDHRLASEGTLMLAGILTTEADQIRDALSARGMIVVREASEKEWWACAARRS